MRRNNRMGRKGNTFDLIIIPAILFSSIIGVIVFMSFFNNVIEDLQSDNTFNVTEANESISNVSGGLPLWIDNAFVFLLSGLIIAVLVSGFFIDTHPIFFVFGLIILLLGGFVNVILEGTATDLIGAEEDYVTLLDGMPKTSFVLNHFFVIFLVVGLLGLIMLFAKGRLMQSGGGGDF